MTCNKCGSQCQGRLCKFCSLEESRDGTWNPGTDTDNDTGDTDDQCPRCGVTISDRERDICEDCQRVQRIVGDMPDDGLDEDDSNRGRLEVDN